MKNTTVAVVVPAYNEEAVIESSLRSLAKVIKVKNVYVVSDGSKDATALLASKVVPNVLALRKNRGKAGALKQLITKYKLTDRYDYIFFFDADTKIGPDFIKEVKKIIASQHPALVVGTVTSHRHGLISAYRVCEYGFTHMVYKNAQNFMGTISVAPGCASVYRSDVLAQLDFSRHTLTEDFDLTLQIHKKKLGEVVYCRKALVVTQDPETIPDYWKQVMRWNTGFWQNFLLHKLYIPNRKINFEVMLLAGDFLLWAVYLILLLARPIQFMEIFGLAMFIMTGINMLSAVIQKQFWAILYAPFFFVFYAINFTSFGLGLIRAAVGGSKTYSWGKVARYAVS